MNVLLEFFLIIIGFILGIWYTSMLVLPLFYGVPKALAGYFRKELHFKAVSSYLVAPLFWTIFFSIAFFALAFFWNNAFNYLRNSGGFNIGQLLGSLMLIFSALFSRKTQADMRREFDEFVFPYKKSVQIISETTIDDVAYQEDESSRLPKRQWVEDILQGMRNAAKNRKEHRKE